MTCLCSWDTWSVCLQEQWETSTLSCSTWLKWPEFLLPYLLGDAFSEMLCPNPGGAHLVTESVCWPMTPLSPSPPPHTAIGGGEGPRRQQTPKLQEEDSSSIPVVTLAQPWYQGASRYNCSKTVPASQCRPGMPDNAQISPSNRCGGVLHLGSASRVPHRGGGTQGCPFPSRIPLFQPLLLVCVGSQCFPSSCPCIYPSGY